MDILRKLRGSLNVATLEDVYEDESHVHIIMELCKGGELVHRIGSKHYSERTVRGVSPAGLVGRLALWCPWKGDKRIHCLRRRGTLLAVAEGLTVGAVCLQVASYMRAVLRTIAQCHSHHILHRDIKPGEALPQQRTRC